MRTVILTPFRAQPGRDVVWQWVRGWISDNYDMPLFVGDNAGSFSPSAARNNAARLAGDWDVALFHDADTIAHPEAVAQAVDMAAHSMQMVVAGDSHMYCDQPSSARIMGSGNASFARPNSFDEHGIYQRPCSGVFAVHRKVFDKVGGYVETLQGWGYEDLVFLQMCGIFAAGNTWVDGHITLHMWHPESPRDHHTNTNKEVWQKLTHYRRRRDPAGARNYLAQLGHTVP
jgi:glycosyltransferase involved in cell wall biosynthesis